MGVCADAPWTDTAYKLVEYDGRPVLKLSTGKRSWPGKKQVYRVLDDQGQLSMDIIGLRGEEIAGAQPLLEQVLRGGRTAGRLATLEDARTLCRDELTRLPKIYQALIDPARYPVSFSTALHSLRAAAEKQIIT